MIMKDEFLSYIFCIKHILKYLKIVGGGDRDVEYCAVAHVKLQACRSVSDRWPGSEQRARASVCEQHRHAENGSHALCGGIENAH